MRILKVVWICFCIGSCSRVSEAGKANNFLEGLDSPNGREDVELIVRSIEKSDRYELRKKGVVYLVSLKLSFPDIIAQKRLDDIVRKYSDAEVEFIIRNMMSAMKP